MNGVALAGRSILVVEDEPLIALDIENCLRAAGASVLVARCLRDVQALVAEHPDLSAAVLDFRLEDGDTGALCEQLNARGIPFIVYTGYPQVGEACHKGIIVQKPAGGAMLIDTLTACLTPRRPPSVDDPIAVSGWRPS